MIAEVTRNLSPSKTLLLFLQSTASTLQESTVFWLVEAQDIYSSLAAVRATTKIDAPSTTNGLLKGIFPRRPTNLISILQATVKEMVLTQLQRHQQAKMK